MSVQTGVVSVPTMRPDRLTACTCPPVVPGGSGTANALVPIQYAGRSCETPTDSPAGPMSFTWVRCSHGFGYGSSPGSDSRIRMDGLQCGPASGAPPGSAAAVWAGRTTVSEAITAPANVARMPLSLLRMDPPGS